MEETVELAESLLTCKMNASKDPVIFSSSRLAIIESLQRRMKDRGKNYTDDNMLKDVLIAKLPRDKHHSLIACITY